MYTYQYGGKTATPQSLVEAQDLVVIRTKDKTIHDLDLSLQARSFLTNMVPVSAFPEAFVTVFKVLDPERSSPLRRRNEIRRQFPQETGVRFAGRVLKDPKTGAIKVYTENFFLKFHDEVSTAECEQVISDFGLINKEPLGFAKNAYFIAAEDGTGLAIFAIAHQLLSDKRVEYCHPELVEERQEKAIHPMQWHLKATQINGQWIRQDVDVEGAWEFTQGEGTTIAIIDDGVDVDHEEFNAPGKVVYPRDTIINRSDARPKFSMESHGTACAGIACAAGNKQASGVAPKARLMPIRSGGLGSLSESKAFQWAADNGADVISCSWGPRDGAWFNPSDPLHTRPYVMPDSARLAINYAVEKGRLGKGCVIVWAAGNGNENVRYDGYASNPKVIAVSASNDTGSRSVYSDYGKAVWCCFPSSDVYYPQFNHPRPKTAGVWTTDRSAEQGYNPGGRSAISSVGDEAGNYTASFGGTSSSCPGVAGVVALMLSINPNLTWSQVKGLIKNSCDKIDRAAGQYDADGHSLFYGYGRINARKAVENAQKTLGPQDHYDIQGVAHFSKSSRVALQEGKLTIDEHDKNRFVGLQLMLVPLAPGLDIAYQLYINRKGPTPWATNGSLAITPDKRRKVIGYAVKLMGPLADRYTVEYQAKLKGKAALVKAADGAVCGTNKKTGKAIHEIKIEVKNR